VPVEVLSNQASKQPGIINNALKMQRILFIRFMTSRINYSLLFMLIKMNVKKRDKFFFFKQNLELFLKPFTLKTYKNKRSPHDVFSPKTSLPNTRAKNLFSKTENNQGVVRFQKQIILDSDRNNFCSQNARSRFQDLF
jgi:hypothetical protein